MIRNTVLFRPVGRAELDLIKESGWRAFPPRLPHQPIFYPVLTEGYAIKIARDWNTRDRASGFVGYVTRFQLPTEFLARYPIHEAAAVAIVNFGCPQKKSICLMQR